MKLIPLAVALLVTSLTSAGAQASRACGVERWAVKIGVDADIGRVDTVAETTTVAWLAALPRPYALAAHGRAEPYELKTYRVIARVVDLLREEDSDWHVVLADTARPEATIIAELPAADCAIGSRYEATFASLAPVMDSVRPGSIVEVTGLGFFDIPHGQRGVAPNAFELHPLTGIRVQKQGSGLAFVAPAAGMSDTVWVNTRSHIYHCRGSRWYGRTARGYFTTEREAVDAGGRPAHGRSCRD